MPVVPGDRFEVEFDNEEDAVVFRRLPGKEDWLEVLAECPEPMEDFPVRKTHPPRRRKL